MVFSTHCDEEKFSTFVKITRHFTEQAGILGCKQKFVRRYYVFTCTFRRKITLKTYLSKFKKQVWNLVVESIGFLCCFKRTLYIPATVLIIYGYNNMYLRFFHIKNIIGRLKWRDFHGEGLDSYLNFEIVFLSASYAFLSSYMYMCVSLLASHIVQASVFIYPGLNGKNV